jgi:hypothetical protein
MVKVAIRIPDPLSSVQPSGVVHCSAGWLLAVCAAGDIIPPIPLIPPASAAVREVRDGAEYSISL